MAWDEEQFRTELCKRLRAYSKDRGRHYSFHRTTGKAQNLVFLSFEVEERGDDYFVVIKFQDPLRLDHLYGYVFDYGSDSYGDAEPEGVAEWIAAGILNEIDELVDADTSTGLEVFENPPEVIWYGRTQNFLR